MKNMPREPKMTEYLHAKAAKLRIPLSGTFELTPVCNMNCRMCYVRLSREQQEAIRPLHTAEEWIDLGRRAKKQGLVYLLLTGGEPFIRKDIKEIVSSLHHMGFIISMNTNATLITEETVKWLKQTPPARMNITLYGASDETYERLCGNPHGFTQATHAIELLRTAGISVKINCSITPYNVNDLEAIILWAKERNLIVQASSYMFPPLRKDPTKIGTNDRFTAEEAAYYAAKLEQFQNGDDDFLQRYNEGRLAGMHNDVEEYCTDTDITGEGDGMRCRAGKCSYWVTWDGRLLACGMFNEKNALNVFESDFVSAWNAAIQEAAAVRLPAKCKACALQHNCQTCAAMVYTETGNYHTAPEYRCRMIQSYPSACTRVRDEILNSRKEQSHEE